MNPGKTYDLKVGYTCNNHCIHCVIEPNINDLKIRNEKLDTSYGDIVKEMESPDFIEAGSVVLTGGEITVRRDFMRIVKTIVKKQPNKFIYIQTNARKLKEYVEELSQVSKNIQYVVAVHSSNEELHNKIVGNKFFEKSPYVETMEAIEEIERVYGDFAKVARIEIVISNINKADLFNTIVDMHKMGVKNIGISYPHLDGFLFSMGIDKVKEIGFSYEELKPTLTKVYRYLELNDELYVEFEEVPRCMWRDEEGKLLKSLKNLGEMGRVNQEISVKFPGQEANHDFAQKWVEMHRYTDKCKSCAMRNSCPGIWFESEEAFGSRGFIPVTNNELNQLGGIEECSC